MRTSSWVAMIGIAIITFIILVASGVLTFKTEPVEESSGSAKTQVVKIVEDDTTGYYKIVDEVINDNAKN